MFKYLSRIMLLMLLHHASLKQLMMRTCWRSQFKLVHSASSDAFKTPFHQTSCHMYVRSAADGVSRWPKVQCVVHQACPIMVPSV